MHAGGRAGAGRDAKPRIVRMGDEAESRAGADEGRRRPWRKAGDEQRSPRREPQPARPMRTRMRDERLRRPASMSPNGAAAPTTIAAPKA